MGSKLLYYLVIIPVSNLPFPLLYLLSDFLYLVLYKIIGYRTKVVAQNLKNSFPNKSKEELKVIEAKFYLHLCDLVVESLKAFSISLNDAQKRMSDRNLEVVNKYAKEGRQIVMVGGHYGNWELFAITIGESLANNAIALYTPLKNEFINEKITQSRSKYGLGLLSIKEIKEKLAALEHESHTIIFGSDQSPRKSQRAYWMKFLNQETGVQFGTEKFAKEFNAVVIFANIFRVKRGFYEIEYELLTETPNEEEVGWITKTHTKKLEKVIQAEPAFWLWSHKRWKHARPEGEVLND
jgi:KDO2-lipid IV(A) lauroyltransferase